MSRPIPPKPEFIVKGNEGYMMRRSQRTHGER